MAFRYFVVDTMNGTVLGTDEESIAREYADSEDFFVIDAKESFWLGFDGDDKIKKIKAES